jgi:hypothetical protein
VSTEAIETAISVEKFSVTPKLLEKLSPDQISMYAILSLGVSEVTAMQKVLQLGPQESVEDEFLNQAYLSQRIVFMRMISSKVLEIFKTLMLKGNENSTDDADLKTFKCEKVLPVVSSLKDHEGSEVAKTIRDKIGFHTDLSHFSSLGIERLTTQEHEIGLGESSFSQFFPFGEIVVAALSCGEDLDANVNNARKWLLVWSDFVAKSLDDLVRIFDEYLREFLFQDIGLRSDAILVPNTLIAEKGLSPFPLFLRNSSGIGGE